MRDGDEYAVTPVEPDATINAEHGRQAPHVFGIDPIADLDHLIGDGPEARRMLAQEHMRVCLTDSFRIVRHELGLSQADMAQRLGISQGRVSRLESVEMDRRMDSVVAYLHAAEAELLMAFRVGDQVIKVVGSQEGWRAAGARLGVDQDDEEGLEGGPWEEPAKAVGSAV